MIQTLALSINKNLDGKVKKTKDKGQQPHNRTSEEEEKQIFNI